MDQLNEYRKFVPTRYIYVSFLFGLLMNMIPANGFIPDIVALLILYWFIVAPDQIGLTTACVLGLLMDVATFSLLGQHALAYTVTGFILLQNRRKILLYNYGLQAFVALGTLLGNQLIISFIGFLASKKTPTLDFFFPVLIGAISWPLLNKIMVTAYRPRVKHR